MLTRKIAALLDRPSSMSFGLVPFAYRVSETVVRTSGMLPARQVSQADLTEILRDGHALPVSGEPVLVAEVGDAACWVGRCFAETLGTVPGAPPLPPAPSRVVEVPEAGSFWVGAPEVILRVQVDWVASAARIALGSEDPAGQRSRERLSLLMAWARPDLDETRAALWINRSTPARQDLELDWQLRLLSDRNGTRGLATRKTLAEHLLKVVARYRPSPSCPATNSAPTTTTT